MAAATVLKGKRRATSYSLEVAPQAKPKQAKPKQPGPAEKRKPPMWEELINGTKFYLFARPMPRHAVVESNVLGAFKNYLKGKRCQAFAEVDVWLDEKANHFVPDVIIVCDPAKIGEERISGAPDLVVEVLSPSTRKNDRGDKLRVYERFGVKEYWIVDPQLKTLEVYLLEDDRLNLEYVYCAEYPVDADGLVDDGEGNKVEPRRVVHVSLYDDLDVPVADVFEGLDFWDKKR